MADQDRACSTVDQGEEGARTAEEHQVDHEGLLLTRRQGVFEVDTYDPWSHLDLDGHEIPSVRQRMQQLDETMKQQIEFNKINAMNRRGMHSNDMNILLIDGKPAATHVVSRLQSNKLAAWSKRELKGMASNDKASLAGVPVASLASLASLGSNQDKASPSSFECSTAESTGGQVADATGSGCDVFGTGLGRDREFRSPGASGSSGSEAPLGPPVAPPLASCWAPLLAAGWLTLA